MKQVYYLLVLFAASHTLLSPLHAQQKREHLFRLYIDNDFINFYGYGTDEAYTSGARADYMYERFQKPRRLPNAGDSSINIEGWSLMHAMFTPKNIFTEKIQIDDYPYSGGLFGIYSLNSYNPHRKYSLQTALLAGVMGPASLAEPSQKLMHRVIGYEKPEGWNNQLANAPLLNVQLTAEKQLYAYGWLEVMAGGSVAAGTMTNGATIYPLLRFGIMHPYFSGFINQYSTSRPLSNRKQWQVYIVAKPAATLTLTQALLTGGVGSSSQGKDIARQHPLNKWGFDFEYGFVASWKRLSFSMMQRHLTPMLKGLYHHEIGKMSACFTW